MPLKKTILFLGIIAICGNMMAQNDTILKYPYLYYYNWPQTGLLDDSTVCTLTDVRASVDYYSFPPSQWSYINEVAYHQYSDSPLEVIGIAFTNYGGRNTLNLTIYDSNMNIIIRDSSSPVSIYWSDWRTDTSNFLILTVPEMSRPSSYFYLAGDEIALRKHFFEKMITISGDYWISLSGDTTFGYPMTGFVIYTLLAQENHEQPYHIAGESYRYHIYNHADSTWSWGEDSLKRSIPEIFLIINPNCNYVDSMTVTTDANGCAYVWWDNVPLQSQWQVNVTGWNLDYTETVDTNYWHYCGLIPNYTYEIKIRSRCTNLYSYSWSEWSPVVQTGHYTPQSLDSPQDIEVSIVPTPSADAVTVSADATLLTLELRDLLGRTVLSQHPSANSTTVDVSTLPAGTYILRFHTPQGVATKKLVVK